MHAAAYGTIRAYIITPRHYSTRNKGDKRMKQTMKAFRNQQLIEQMRWMQERGTTLAGYLLHYCTRPQAEVEAIYKADLAELQRVASKAK